VIKISVNRKNRKKIRKITWPHHLYGQQRINDNSKKKKRYTVRKIKQKKKIRKIIFGQKKRSDAVAARWMCAKKETTR
jgi:hypothetical protein